MSDAVQFIIAISDFICAGITILATLIGINIWLRPVKISPGVRLVLDGSDPDEITVTITSKSNKPIYVTSCVSRGVYPRRYTLMRLLRQPFMAPHFYPVIQFGGPTHDLLGKDPIKIEPQQPVDLRHRLSSHAMSKFQNDEFLIEVQLSNGRKFRSGRQNVPSRWRLQCAA